MSDSGRQIGDARERQFTDIVTVKTANSVYRFHGNEAMLVSGTPSKHLGLGQWVEIASHSTPKVGERLAIVYLDGLVRTTTPILSIVEGQA